MASKMMTPEQVKSAVAAARTILLDRWPFIGHLALNLRPIADESVPTACVSIDGTLRINPDFLGGLTPRERVGLIAHEVLHPALACWARRGDRKDLVSLDGGQVVSLWNLAHDLSFNTMIRDYGARTGAKILELPAGACVDDAFKDMSAEEIYDILLKRAGQNKRLGYSSSIGDDVQPGAATPDGQKAERNDPVARRKLENDWKVNVLAAAQAQERADGRGSLPGWLQRLIDEIAEPKLDWREEMSRWVGENGPRNDYSFRRPSRRSHAVGHYLPALTKYGIADDVTVLLDTSGSIGGNRLKQALGEIEGICTDLNVSVRVIVVDAQIHADLEVASVIEALDKITGGGGSDYRPAFERLEQELYDGIVVAITDGCIGVPATMPSHLKGCLWVLGTQEAPPCSWGEVVRMPV